MNSTDNSNQASRRSRILNIVGLSLMWLLVCDICARRFFHLRLLSEWAFDIVLVVNALVWLIAVAGKRRAENERAHAEVENE